MFSEAETSFERALRDAAMQKLALSVLASSVDAAAHDMRASCAVMSIAFAKPATAIVMRYVPPVASILYGGNY